MSLKQSKENLIIGYKLLADTLFLFLIFFTLALIADGLIPGIVSDHISFLKMILALSLNLLALQAVGQIAKIKLIETTSKKRHEKMTTLLAVIGTLLVFNGLLKLNLYLAFSLLTLAIISGYFIYKNFFFKKT